MQIRVPVCFFALGVCLGIAAPVAAQSLDGPSAERVQALKAAGKKTTAGQDTPAPAATPENSAALALLNSDGHQDGIAATVNDEPISQYDLNQRIALFAAMSGITLTEDTLKTMRAQVLKQLQDETLRLQEAKRKKITVSVPEVDRRILRIIEDNGMTRQQFSELLARTGASEAALRSQIVNQIAWAKTVSDEYGAQVRINDADIDSELARLLQGANKPHFHLYEIFLAVDKPDQAPRVQADAEKLIEQIKQGANFQTVARQFSQNPTAASGGEVGWVDDGQIAPELAQTLSKMQTGTISDPVRSRGGYYILLLRARQEPAGTKAPDPATLDKNPPGKMPLARLLLPLPPRPGKEMLDQANKFAAGLRGQIMGAVRNCQGLENITSEVKGSVYQNLGMVTLADLSNEIQQSLAKTGPGDTAEPILSPAGIELIIRCDTRPEVIQAYKVPSRRDVEAMLYDEQITAWANRYMRDLKRTANVETR